MIDIILFGALAAILTFAALLLIDKLGSTLRAQRSNQYIEAAAGTLPVCGSTGPAVLSDCGSHARIRPSRAILRAVPPANENGDGTSPVAFPSPEVRLEA